MMPIFIGYRIHINTYIQWYLHTVQVSRGRSKIILSDPNDFVDDINIMTYDCTEDLKTEQQNLPATRKTEASNVDLELE